MTSDIAHNHVPERPQQPSLSAESTAVIDEQLQKTRRQVKGVDIAAGLLTLGVGVIGYLFLLALADHWLFYGGLGFGTRLTALVILVIAAGGFAYSRVLQPILRKINPIFVAHTIEAGRPSLKNSLVNFLLLRGSPQAISPGVYQAVETRAADDLAGVSPEAVVDRSHVMRLATAFVVLILIGGIYHIASPKSPLTSALRVAWPWNAAAAPTRVTITDVKPGDVTAFYGESITVSADVSGVAAAEPVNLYFDTSDGQSVDEAIPMQLSEGGYRYHSQLPPGKLGLRQNLQYYIAAGDCRTKKYAVTVETPPVIEVESVDYHYPSYSEIPDRSAQRQGDIRALEGTEITIHSAANMPISEAEIDLNCKGLRGLRMKAEGNRAVGRFTLRMNVDDPTQPSYDCYQIRFSDEAGRENLRPVRYDIDIIADRPPSVRFKDPPNEHIDLPENGTLQLQVEAEDPDFALSKVTIRAQRDGRGLSIPAMFDKRIGEPPHKGPFEGSYLLKPAALGLRVGDQVVYWAEATDNKTPLPNVAETQRFWITVVEPSKDEQREKQDQNGQQQNDQQQGQSQQGENQQSDQQQGQQDEGQQDQGQQGDQQQSAEGQQGQQQKGDQKEGQQQGSNDQQGGQPQSQQDQESQRQDQQDGQQQGDQKQSGQRQQDQQPQQNEGQQGDEDKQGGQQQSQEQQPGGKPSEPIDGESNPGDVFERALEHIKKQQEKQQGEQSDSQQDDQQTSEGEQGERQPSGKQQGRDEQGQQEPAEQQQEEDGQEQQEPIKQQTEKSEQGQQKPAEQPSGDGEQGQKKPSEQQIGDSEQNRSESAGQESDKSEASRQELLEKQPGEKEQGQQPSSMKQEGDGEQSQQKPSERQPDKGEQSQSKPSDQKPGEKTPDQTESTEQQTGQGVQDEGTQGQEDTSEQKTGASEEDEHKSSDRQKPSEQKPGEKKSGEREQGEREKSDRPEADEKGAMGQDGAPSGRNPSGVADAEETQSEPETAESEAFNKQYAEKATDLVLEEFEKQLAKKKPDQDLLDSLGGWTREDLEHFTRRWLEMKQSAEHSGSPGARQELNNALRSLGLSPSRTDIRGGTQQDDIRRLRQHRRIAPPPQWAPQTRAYKRSIGTRDKPAK